MKFLIEVTGSLRHPTARRSRRLVIFFVVDQLDSFRLKSVVPQQFLQLFHTWCHIVPSHPHPRHSLRPRAVNCYRRYTSPPAMTRIMAIKLIKSLLITLTTGSSGCGVPPFRAI